MTKKIIFCLVLLLMSSSLIFAQSAETKSANVKSNWISGEATVLGIGAGLRYERMLGPKFSLGVMVYESFLLIAYLDIGIDVVARDIIHRAKHSFWAAGLELICLRYQALDMPVSL
jgi:hypothetical protein